MEKLYYIDQYIKEFTAEIVEVLRSKQPISCIT